MNPIKLKEEAFRLRQTGLSFKDIAEKLNISKTQAYEYVKELKYIRENFKSGTPKPSSELVPNVRSERTVSGNPVANSLGQSSNPLLKVKEFTGDELIMKKFDSLNFQGKFRELIGKPARYFSGIIWGLPKGGKSNLSIRFADYLQEYFGKVVYVAAEEGESVTLQEKFKEIGGSSVTIIETRNRDVIREYLKAKDFDFVFIDSINNAGIDSDFLEMIKEENPEKSFVSIVQATKGGTFKGDQSLTHNCDFIIKVVNGIASHTGRFGHASEIEIFTEPLYQKNPQKKEKPIEALNGPVKKASKQDTVIQAPPVIDTEYTEVKEVVMPEPQPLSPDFIPHGLIQASQKIMARPQPQRNYPVLYRHAPNPVAGKILLFAVGALILDSVYRKSKKQNDSDNLI